MKLIICVSKPPKKEPEDKNCMSLKSQDLMRVTVRNILKFKFSLRLYCLTIVFQSNVMNKQTEIISGKPLFENSYALRIRESNNR